MKKGIDLKKKLRGRKKLHFGLIDPMGESGEERSEEEIKRLAKALKDSDGIMVGGTTVKTRESVDKTIKAIKEVTKGIPVILFPNSAEAVSRYADYIFFMMLMNSKRRKFLIGEQFKGASLVAKYKLKTISMGYIIISTSKEPTMVEQVADLDKIGKEDIDKLVDYARTTQYLGKDCVYLEAGSGADESVPNEMISAVRKAISIPIIVGGGIRDKRTAEEKMDAGATVVVTGTSLEESIRKSKGIISAIKNFRRKKS